MENKKLFTIAPKEEILARVICSACWVNVAVNVIELLVPGTKEKAANSLRDLAIEVKDKFTSKKNTTDEIKQESEEPKAENPIND